MSDRNFSYLTCSASLEDFFVNLTDRVSRAGESKTVFSRSLQKEIGDYYKICLNQILLGLNILLIQFKNNVTMNIYLH